MQRYNQQGYGGQRYGGRYGQNIGYRGPTIQQRESFFNPIPLDFIQGQFDKRQGAYDQAFAGTLQAKEQMQQQQTALSDLGAKNEFINEVITNIDKTVEEQFGGDWGRAGKTIAKQVSQARMNPLWESSKYKDEQGKIEQEFRLKNPNANIYNSVLSNTTIDPETGRPRSQDDLTFKGNTIGDYAGNIEKQFDDVTADVIQGALNKAKGQFGDQYLTQEKTEQITNDTLRSLAKNGAQTFVDNNPEFGKWLTHQGKSPEEILQLAEDKIFGQIQDKEYSRNLNQNLSNKQFGVDAAAKAAAAKAAKLNSQPRTNMTDILENTYLQSDKVVNDTNFNADGGVKTLEERKKEKIDLKSPASYEPLFTPYGINFKGLLARGADAYQQINAEVEEKLAGLPITPLGAAIDYNEWFVDLVRKVAIKNDSIHI